MDYAEISITADGTRLAYEEPGPFELVGRDCEEPLSDAWMITNFDPKVR